MYLQTNFHRWKIQVYVYIYILYIYIYTYIILYIYIYIYVMLCIFIHWYIADVNWRYLPYYLRSIYRIRSTYGNLNDKTSPYGQWTEMEINWRNAMLAPLEKVGYNGPQVWFMVDVYIVLWCSMGLPGRSTLWSHFRIWNLRPSILGICKQWSHSRHSCTIKFLSFHSSFYALASGNLTYPLLN